MDVTDIRPDNRWPFGRGEMAERIRAFDWATTPLGPIKAWGQGLKTVVDLMLDSPGMMSLVWGTEAIHIYNDAFTALLREHRHGALGRSAFVTFAQSRDVFAGDIAAGMAGTSARLLAQRYPVLRNGRMEDAWFDVDYVPVRDETGTVAGVLWALKETTAQILAQHVLRESEARHRLLIGSWAQALWEADSDGVVVADSPSWRASTGQTLDEWLGYGWLDAIHPDDRAFAEQQWRDAIAARSLVDAEFRLRAPDGGWRWTNVRAAPVLDGTGRIVKWAGMNIDIDARKRAEEAVRSGEERYRSELERRVAEATAELKASRDLLRGTMDASTDMIQVFEAVRDEAGEIVDFNWILNNHTSEHRYGEVSGESLLTRNPGVVVEGIFDAFRRVTETGVPEQAERHYVHEQFDGWFYQSVVKLNDGVATTTKEISDWKRSQAEVLRLKEEAAAARLRESEERLRQFGEASSDILWIRDAKSLRWTYLTPAFDEIYGLSGEVLRAADDLQRWLAFIVPADRDAALDALERVREGKKAQFEYRIERPGDGEIRWIRDTDFPIRDENGTIVAIGGIGHDVTAEKAASSRQEVLFTELQHRTRNLIAVVRAIADRTAERADDLPSFLLRYRERLGALSRINSLLSQLESGDRVTFDELLRTELKARGFLDGESMGRVRLDGLAGIRLRSASVQTVALAIHELATNAVKYGALSDPEGQLRVSWQMQAQEGGADRLRIEWKETGVSHMPGTDASPQGGGYGRTLIERALPYQLGARTAYDLGPDGVRCTIDLPL